MSNPFADDEYGRPLDSSRGFPAGKTPPANQASDTRTLDRIVLLAITLLVVLTSFTLILFLMTSLSPETPIRLTPEAATVGDDDAESEEELQIRGGLTPIDRIGSRREP